MCGKTGTAQLASNEFLKGNTRKNMKDNAWFVGFAPRQSPEIVVVALFEHGEHGHLAAPIVRDVIKAYFDKKARLVSELNKLAAATSAARAAELKSFGLPAAGAANRRRRRRRPPARGDSSPRRRRRPATGPAQ